MPDSNPSPRPAASRNRRPVRGRLETAPNPNHPARKNHRPAPPASRTPRPKKQRANLNQTKTKEPGNRSREHPLPVARRRARCNKPIKPSRARRVPGGRPNPARAKAANPVPDSPNENRPGSGGGQNPSGTSQKQAPSSGGQPRPNEEPQSPSMSRKASGSQGDAGGNQSGGGKQGGGQGGNQPGPGEPRQLQFRGPGRWDVARVRQRRSRAASRRQTRQAQGRTGQSGYEPGAGSTAKPAAEGAGGSGQQGESSQSGPSTSPPKSPSGDAPSPGGQGLPLGGGNPSSAELKGGDMSGEVPPGEQPNLDYAEKATDMVLEYLKDQESQPDEDLLKKLGWTKEDLQDFVQRWSELKRTAREDQRAKQELDDALRSLGLRPAARGPRRAEVREDPRRAERNLGVPATPRRPTANSSMPTAKAPPASARGATRRNDLSRSDPPGTKRRP